MFKALAASYQSAVWRRTMCKLQQRQWSALDCIGNFCGSYFHRYRIHQRVSAHTVRPVRGTYIAALPNWCFKLPESLALPVTGQEASDQKLTLHQPVT
jgi:hypothetical protein